MPRDVSGTYTAPSNSFNPAVDGTDIEPADWNAILIDLVGQGLNVIPASLITGDLKLANFNSGTGASATTFWRGDRTWQPVVVGPNSSTDNAAARFDAATGKIIQDSALIIADTTGALSRTGGGGIPVQGTNTNNNAAAGDVGQVISSVVTLASGVTLTTATAATVTSVALTAGDWVVSGILYFQGTAATGVTSIEADLSPTTNTAPTTPGAWGQISPSTTLAVITSISLPPYRVSLAGSASYFLTATATFGGGAVKGSGYIQAVRIR